MLTGTVDLQATIRGNRVQFLTCEFDPKEPGVDRAVVEAPDGREIRITVHFASVASKGEAHAKAKKVSTVALNRIAFHHDLIIDNARITGDQLSPVTPTPHAIQAEAGSYAITGPEIGLVVGIGADRVKSLLEQGSTPGEQYYGLFRLAGQATSPVEKFMLFYYILLMLHDDKQRDVDEFIVSQEPSVPQTPDPRDRNRMETIYTRLRNEFSHPERGVSPERTRSDMAANVTGLKTLAKRAIELHA